jgi:coenzyme F420-reducing hydrogenase alpha subunit
MGYESAIHMAKDHKEVVTEGLALKKAGNGIVALLGGREIHPINQRLGGFYRVPTRRELQELAAILEPARDRALAMVALFAGFDFPDYEPDYELVSMSHPDEYPFNEGRIISNKGLDVAVSEFNDTFTEEHVAHSTSLQSRVRGRGAYQVGPIARYSLNFEKLHPPAQRAAIDAGLGATCLNPFRSIVVRAVETVHAVEEALEIIDRYEPPPEPAVAVSPAAGEGHGASEAPRGLLYHRYRIDDEGLIQDAQITPPTAQNQMSIEDDLRNVVLAGLDLPDDELQWRLEQTIRNYDPCISCSTHFLRLEVDRE